MPTPRSRITADVRPIELIALKVHVKALPPVEHLDDVRKLTLSASSASPTTFANCLPSPAVLKKLYDPVMSGEYMSEPHHESQLGLFLGVTYTWPAARACDRFAICTRYARYFAFPPPTRFGSLAQ